MSSLATPPTLLIACLCAQWCGTCRDFEAVFESLQSERPAARWVWIDIEDQADLVGELDIETFPTLLIAHKSEQGLVRLGFGGPILPRAQDASRIIQTVTENLIIGGKLAPHVDAEQRLTYEALARSLLS